MIEKQIIEKGILSTGEFISLIPLGYKIFIAMMVISTLYFIVSAIVYKKFRGSLVPAMVPLTILAITLLILPLNQYKEDFYKKWLNKYVSPYLHSLPLEKKDILTYHEKIVGSKSNMEIQTTIVFLDDKGFEHKIKENKKFKKNIMKSGTPYVTYRELKKDLGNEIKPGLYEIIVHIPQGLEQKMGNKNPQK
jgi:hypothetical protein